MTDGTGTIQGYQEWLTAERLAAVEAHIADYTPRLIRHTTEPKDFFPEGVDRNDPNAFCLKLLPLPNPYVIPADEVFEAQFYWDSYFTCEGLRIAGRYDLVKGMTDNMLVMVERYGHVPSASATLWLNNVSQPPFLSTLVRQVFDHAGDREWLAWAFTLLRREYTECWRATRHEVFEGLAGYFSVDGTVFWSEAESGWDFTPRFGDSRHCVAVDLNALLYKYETDFAAIATELGDAAEAARWRAAAEVRREMMNRYLWNEADGLFYDYDFVAGEQRPVKSLAAYFPLWAGLTTPAQNERLVASLALFEQDWGLTTCDRNYIELPSLIEFEGAILPNERKQWNWPNGWAPLHWIVLKGLHDQGYLEDARRIGEKLVACIARNFEETGKVWEKYNVVDGNTNVTGRYKMAFGFGWTNAIFLALRRLLEI